VQHQQPAAAQQQPAQLLRAALRSSPAQLLRAAEHSPRWFATTILPLRFDRP